MPLDLESSAPRAQRAACACAIGIAIFCLRPPETCVQVFLVFCLKMQVLIFEPNARRYD